MRLNFRKQNFIKEDIWHTLNVCVTLAEFNPNKCVMILKKRERGRKRESERAISMGEKPDLTIWPTAEPLCLPV